MSALWGRKVLLRPFGPTVPLLRPFRPEVTLEIADTLCGYSPFGVYMTKEVMWANLDAPNVEAAIHMENRTQILASTTGDVIEAAAVARRPIPTAQAVLSRRQVPNQIAAQESRGPRQGD